MIDYLYRHFAIALGVESLMYKDNMGVLNGEFPN